MAQHPLFCPNSNCPNHQGLRDKDWFRSFGYYRTKAHGTVKRYVCQNCGKSFSDQTFRLSYYLKLDLSFKDLLFRISACEGIRAIARSYSVTDKVIANRVGRLARQVIGAIAELRSFGRLSEDLAADGFESFIRSQYSPNNIHHLIGTSSQYVYACDLAHLRRKGRMTAAQRSKRERLEAGEIGFGQEIISSFERICATIQDLRAQKEEVILHTDEKREYQTVLKQNRYLDGKVRHKTTSSRRARTFRNPLWPVNYYDRELRKDQASHVRETTRWANEANNCMERIYLYAGYHNFFKPFRIKQRDKRTHAEAAGFDALKIKSIKNRFFTKRYFFSKVPFSPSEWLVWLRGYRTPFRQAYQTLPAFVTGQGRSRNVSLAA